MRSLRNYTTVRKSNLRINGRVVATIQLDTMLKAILLKARRNIRSNTSAVDANRVRYATVRV